MFPHWHHFSRQNSTYYVAHQNQILKARVKWDYHITWVCADGFFGNRGNSVINVTKLRVCVHVAFRDLFPGWRKSFWCAIDITHLSIFIDKGQQSIIQLSVQVLTITVWWSVTVRSYLRKTAAVQVVPETYDPHPRPCGHSSRWG